MHSYCSPVESQAESGLRSRKEDISRADEKSRTSRIGAGGCVREPQKKLSTRRGVIDTIPPIRVSMEAGSLPERNAFLVKVLGRNRTKTERSIINYDGLVLRAENHA